MYLLLLNLDYGELDTPRKMLDLIINGIPGIVAPTTGPVLALILQASNLWEYQELYEDYDQQRIAVAVLEPSAAHEFENIT